MTFRRRCLAQLKSMLFPLDGRRDRAYGLRPRLTARLIFDPNGSVRPARRLCEITIPFFCCEYARPILPVVQWLRSILRVATAMRFPITWGTLQVGRDRI